MNILLDMSRRIFIYIILRICEYSKETTSIARALARHDMTGHLNHIVSDSS